MNVTGRNRFLKFLIKFEIYLNSMKKPRKIESFLGCKMPSFWQQNKKSLVIGDYQAGLRIGNQVFFLGILIVN